MKELTVIIREDQRNVSPKVLKFSEVFLGFKLWAAKIDSEL